MYIGADLGTTGCKAVLFTDSGLAVTEFNKEYNLIFKGDRIFQDACDWWSIICEAIKYCTSHTGGEPVHALSISTQSISLVPVDKDGVPLALAISWMDVSATDELTAIEKKFGSGEIYRRTGKPLKCAYTLPKLMRFVSENPEIYRKAHLLLTPLDYLNFRLTGVPVTDCTVASGTMYFDIMKRCWDNEILSFAGITEDKLPNIGEMGDLIGYVLPQVAKDLGLSEKTAVMLGGQDQKLAALGAGIKKGVFTLSLGTAAAISSIEESPSAKSAKCPLFAFNKSTAIAETSLYAGVYVKWAAKTLLGVSYGEFDKLAESFEHVTCGVSFDINDETKLFSLGGLSLAAKREDIAYAVLSGIARGIKEKTAMLGGTKKIIVFGGGSKSDIWCRIISRVTGCELLVSECSETASLGAAVLASGGKISSSKIVKNFIS